ncbi:hypothetical protein EDC01DRAFT_237962 [Geopyxis carbonaria]|nr:hypothetical protein EDC01DRAFT_237962 [Geopyxis carbonaria]
MTMTELNHPPITSCPEQHVDFLILGAGWTSIFLLPLLTSSKISHAATTRAGSATTIPFTFDPDSDSPEPYKKLPTATTVLIVFPITTPEAPRTLTKLYNSTHPSSTPANFIALGATFVWPSGGNRHTPIEPTARGVAEAALIELGGSVLNLSGLWGGQRAPWNFMKRVADTKEKLAKKETLHLIHGHDVARAIVAVHKNWKGGERWCLTDCRSYDWWDLAMSWGDVEKKWVGELMEETKVGVLPRVTVGRKLEAVDFWNIHGLWPERCLVLGPAGVSIL